MIFILGQRRSGKTKAILEAAAKTGATVIVADERRADWLRECARTMGIQDVVVRAVEVGRVKPYDCEIYVDDAEIILERVLGCPVTLATFDARKVDMRKMTLLDMLAEWRRQRRIEKCGMLED